MDPLPGCQQTFGVYIWPFVTNIYIYNTIKLSLCGIHVSYLLIGAQCLLIEHDNSRVRIIMLLNVLNVLQVQERDHLANIIQTQKKV